MPGRSVIVPLVADVTMELWREQDRHPGERVLLLAAVADAFEIERVLYPGSWVDVAASFVFPDVVYVDTDPRAARFFADGAGVAQLAEANRRYAETPRIEFHAADYGSEFGAADRSFELIGAVNRRMDAYRVTTGNLGGYLVPKRDVRVTPELLEKTGKAVAYTRSPAAYLFRVRP